jgi:hypothetical protein
MYFLRTDTMHGLYTYLEKNPGRQPVRFNGRSHGEGSSRFCQGCSVTVREVPGR